MSNIEVNYEVVREFFDYDPETGIVTWRVRDVKWFVDTVRYSAETHCAWWNRRFSGKEAGAVNNDTKYRTVGIKGRKNYPIHRIIWLWMTGEWPDTIDHENGIRDDNRWCNLRNVTAKQNSQNRKLRKDKRDKDLPVGISRRTQLQKSGSRLISYDYLVVQIWPPEGKQVVKMFSLHKRDEKEVYEAAMKLRNELYEKFGYHPNHGRK